MPSPASCPSWPTPPGIPPPPGRQPAGWPEGYRRRVPNPPRLSLVWAELRSDTGLKGHEWSRAAQLATDEWLRQLFAAATGAPGTGATSPGTGATPPGPGVASRQPAGGQSQELAGQATGRLGWLRRASRSQAYPASGGQSSAGVALLAVGSLGRGDLSPGSDLDLVLVHTGLAGIAELADRLWYPIWDDPMPLDHSVRTIGQMEEAARSDLKVAQGLLEARAIAGDMELAGRAIAAVRRLWQGHVGRWLPEVLAARRSAWEAHGDVAFLLEPELQESRGGLRDLQLLSLLATVTPVMGQVVANERLGPAGAFLHAARVELQRPGGRRSERLTLEDQPRVAEALGMASREELAREVAAAGRTIAWLAEDADRRARSWLAGPKGRGGSADRPIEAGLVVRDGEVAVPLSAASSPDASRPLRAAAASAQLGLPLSRSAMDLLAQKPPLLAEPWPPEVARALLRLLSCGRAAVHAIETLDQLGVWEHYLPEWALVRNRPQFNPYHRYTVDRHLLETVANTAAAQRDVRRPDLLAVAALLHDIGKGAAGDHSEAGAAIAAQVAGRLGLSHEDTEVLVRVVRHHLLLPDTATRRDLEDPATAAMVAQAVQDATTLELLHALAAADGAATGPAAWNPWRAGLVQELVARTGAVLADQPPPESAPFPAPEHRRLLAAGGFQAHPAGRELVVVAPDRPGLLSDVTGTLALHGVGILEARAHSEDGMALEVFSLDLPEDAHPRWGRIVADLERATDRRFDVGAALAAQAPSRALRQAVALGVPGARVMVDNGASAKATVVEVRALDAPGVLHQIAAAIAGQGLDIVSARVATLGTAVVDSFYVRDGQAKLQDEAQVEALRSAITQRLRDIGASG